MDFFSAPKESLAEKHLKPLLLDEGCHVLSTFELNQIASLTYGELVCDEIFELMEKLFSKPMEYTPLTLQKTLVVLKHILIYGSEKCVNSGYGIGAFVDFLQNFNTVLLARQQQGTVAFFQRLQGGGVDKGGPVREAATAVHQLLSNINELQRIRNASASKDSLVPIGSDKVAFITDEVRHYLLKKKIDEHQRIHIKSNLAKSDGGFGGGYSATDGKNVVGAAHGIEEMIKMVKKEKKRFSDDGPAGESEEEKILNELLAEAQAAKAEMEKEKEKAAKKAAKSANLFGGFNPTPAPAPAPAKQVDLLDFGGGTSTPAVNDTTTDFLGGLTETPAPAQSSSDVYDFFGMTDAAPTTAHSSDLLGLGGGSPPSSNGLAQHDNLLSMTSTPGASLGGMTNTTEAVDPFALVLTTQAPTVSSTSLGGGGHDDLLSMNTTGSAPFGGMMNTTQPADPFASFLTNPAPPPPPGPGPSLSPATSCESGGITSMMTTMAIGSGQSTPSQKRPVMASNVDRFAALDDLASTSSKSTVTALDAKNAENRLLGATATSSWTAPAASSRGLGDLSLSNIPPLPTEMSPAPPLTAIEPWMAMPSDPAPLPKEMVQPGTGHVAANYGDDDDDNPWVMGGVVGSGLQPVAPAPGAAPPPPPPQKTEESPSAFW